MQEHHVTVAGERHDLPTPFHVLATQNPLEQEGTYPLPEAQLDRFLMQIDVAYPDRAAERRILIETTGDSDAVARAALDADDLRAIQRLVRRLPVGDSIVEAILDLVRARRGRARAMPEIVKHIAWGPGPRAAQALMLATRARALVEGRLAPSMDDIAALAEPILKHRMALTFRGARRRRDDSRPGGASRRTIALNGRHRATCRRVRPGPLGARAGGRAVAGAASSRASSRRRAKSPPP